MSQTGSTGPGHRFNRFQPGSFLVKTSQAEVQLRSSAGLSNWTRKVRWSNQLSFECKIKIIFNTKLHFNFNIFAKFEWTSLKFKPFKQRTVNQVSVFQVKLRESKIFNSLLRKQNIVSSRGFVKISTSWFSVFTCDNSISPFASWSLRKWCLISICLVLECCTGLLASLIALSLSHSNGILLNSTKNPQALLYP